MSDQKISRRRFLKLTGLVGGAAAATTIAGCTPAPTPVPAKPTEAPKPAAPAATTAPAVVGAAGTFKGVTVKMPMR